MKRKKGWIYRLRRRRMHRQAMIHAIREAREYIRSLYDGEVDFSRSMAEANLTACLQWIGEEEPYV